MNKPRVIRWVAAAIVLLVTLFFGLDPKGYDFSNHVSWLSGRPGIHFGKYGIAFAQLNNDVFARVSSERNGFSLLMAFRPESLSQEGFNHILSIHAGSDRDQLVIGQWHSYIIVMSGDDYAHRKKTKRVTARLPATPKLPIFLSVTTGEKGTALFIGGEAVKSDPSLTLTVPTGKRPELTIGNSVYGKHSWQGDVYGVALYDRELSAESIASGYKAWSEKQLWAAANGENPVLLYLFDEKGGSNILDHAGSSSSLIIPDRATPLEKIILAKLLPESGLSRSFFQDAIINLIGFMPLGFFLAAVLIDVGGDLKKRALLLTVLFCFGTSFIIEILQAWMPSRSSQSLDLILNTCGGLIGAMLLKATFFLNKKL